MSFVLVETFVSKQQGCTIWFKQMTGIGPQTTADPEERATFATREDAAACPATRHLLSSYEIHEVAALPGDTDG